MSEDELLTTDELAALLKVPPSRLCKERLTGRSGIPHVKMGHLVRYRLSDYRAWLASLPTATSTSERAVA